MNMYKLIAFTTKLEMWDLTEEHKMLQKFEQYKADPACVFVTLYTRDIVVAHYARS